MKTEIVADISKIRRMRRRGIRYIICTSMALTPNNVDDLMIACKPYLRSEQDIFDLHRLESLLDNDRMTLRQHYKLWMANTDVIERVNRAATLSRTDDWREQILHDAITFVQPKNMAKARDILRQRGVIVISGPPGVGKTTLGNLLAMEYMADGYAAYRISEDVSEAEGLYASGARQVFMYDDFLGQTSVTEKLGKREDDRIVALMRRVIRGDRHKFILTTREYILRAAQQTYEKLSADDVETSKCTLEVGHYDRTAKAEILYNHLYHSRDLNDDDLRRFALSGQHRAIISHPQYTPRHIADAISLMTKVS